MLVYVVVVVEHSATDDTADHSREPVDTLVLAVHRRHMGLDADDAEEDDHWSCWNLDWAILDKVVPIPSCHHCDAFPP